MHSYFIINEAYQHMTCVLNRYKIRISGQYLFDIKKWNERKIFDAF